MTLLPLIHTTSWIGYNEDPVPRGEWIYGSLDRTSAECVNYEGDYAESAIMLNTWLICCPTLNSRIPHESWLLGSI
jgi:hypothetical protein